MSKQKGDVFDTIDNESDRYKRGMAILQQVGGADYDAPIRALQDIAPALGRFTVEFGYGDVLSRPTLGLKPRQLCTVAALAALGNAAPQLRYHIHGARNVGWSPGEIIEVLMVNSMKSEHFLRVMHTFGGKTQQEGTAKAAQALSFQVLMSSSTESVHDP